MKNSIELDFTNEQTFIFGNLFLIANKLQIVCDQYLEKSGLTTKQWFLVAAIQQFTNEPPTLSQVSELIGSSRQNVKQLAMKLEKNGFLTIKQTSRAVRLVLTKECTEFWANRAIQDKTYIADIFRYLHKEDLDTMSKSIKKLLQRIEEISVP